MPSNLMPDYKNAYWRAADQIDLYAKVGTYLSNTYLGSSQAYGNIYEHTATSPGDEIHALVGGTFWIYVDGDDGQVKVREVALSVSDKHLFEKVYVPPRETWPLAKLEQITRPTRPETGYRTEDVVTLDEALSHGAKRHGRSIDYVYS